MEWATLEARKKTTLIITAVLFLFVVWQGIKMVKAKGADANSFYAEQTAGPDVAQTADNAPVQNVSDNHLMYAQAPAGGRPGGPGAMPMKPKGPPPMTRIPARGISPEDIVPLQQSRQMRLEYTNLVNQYQLLQMRSRVAKARAELAKNMGEIVKEQLKMIESKAKIQQFEGVKVDTDPSTYGVAYIGKDRGRWTAILTSGKQYYDVVEGTVLPKDIEVVSITPKTVLLQDKDERHLLRLPMTAADEIAPPMDKEAKDKDKQQTQVAEIPGYSTGSFLPDAKNDNLYGPSVSPEPVMQDSGPMQQPAGQPVSAPTQPMPAEPAFAPGAMPAEPIPGPNQFDGGQMQGAPAAAEPAAPPVPIRQLRVPSLPSS